MHRQQLSVQFLESERKQSIEQIKAQMSEHMKACNQIFQNNAAIEQQNTGRTTQADQELEQEFSQTKESMVSDKPQ